MTISFEEVKKAANRVLNAMHTPIGWDRDYVTYYYDGCCPKAVDRILRDYAVYGVEEELQNDIEYLIRATIHLDCHGMYNTEQ